MDILQRMPWLAQDAVFKRLSEIAEVASLSKEERKQYDESLRHYRDTIIVMEGQYMEGEKKGRDERTYEIAANMKRLGMNVDDIVRATGLTSEDINEL